MNLSAPCSARNRGIFAGLDLDGHVETGWENTETEQKQQESVRYMSKTYTREQRKDVVPMAHTESRTGGQK